MKANLIRRMASHFAWYPVSAFIPVKGYLCIGNTTSANVAPPVMTRKKFPTKLILSVMT
jgi:hypothetical protein